MQVLCLRAFVHFLKVTASYWSGLFHCYSAPGLPRTNNDLEHIFGTVRYHHRRCTGHKVAPATLVLRGSVQLIACLATGFTTWSAQRLATVSIIDWRLLRSQLEQHRIHRVEQRRFRRSPADYLANKRISTTLVNFATVEKNKWCSRCSRRAKRI